MKNNHTILKIFVTSLTATSSSVIPILSSCSVETKQSTGVNKWFNTTWLDNVRGNLFEISYNPALKQCKANSIIIGSDKYLDEQSKDYLYVPDTINIEDTEYPLVEINNVKFGGNSSKKIRYVDFSDATNLKKIGPSCFENITIDGVIWKGLTSLEEIGDKAFKNTHMKASDDLVNRNSVDLSNTRIKRIGNEAFYGMGNWRYVEKNNQLGNAWNFVFPETLEEIGDYAFNGDQVHDKVNVGDIVILSLGLITLVTGLVTTFKGVSGMKTAKRNLAELSKTIKSPGVKQHGRLMSIKAIPYFATFNENNKLQELKQIEEQSYNIFAKKYGLNEMNRKNTIRIPALNPDGSQMKVKNNGKLVDAFYWDIGSSPELMKQKFGKILPSLTPEQRVEYLKDCDNMFKARNVSEQDFYALQHDGECFAQIHYAKLIQEGDSEEYLRQVGEEFDRMSTALSTSKQIKCSDFEEGVQLIKRTVPEGADPRGFIDDFASFNDVTTYQIGKKGFDYWDDGNRDGAMSDVIGVDFYAPPKGQAEYGKQQAEYEDNYSVSQAGFIGGLATTISGASMIAGGLTEMFTRLKAYKDDSPNCSQMHFLGQKPPKLGKNWAPRMFNEKENNIISKIYVPAENNEKVNLNCNSETGSKILNAYLNNNNSNYDEVKEKRELKKDVYNTSLISYDESQTKHDFVGYQSVAGAVQPGFKINYPKDQLKTTSPFFNDKLTCTSYTKGVGIPRYVPKFSLRRSTNKHIKIDPFSGNITWDATLSPGTYHFNIMTTLYEQKEDPNNPGFVLGEEYFCPAGYAVSKDMTLTIKPSEDAIRLDMKDVYHGTTNEPNYNGEETKYKVTYADIDESEFDDDEYHLGSLKLKLVGAPDGVELKNGRLYWNGLPKGVYHFNVVAERHEPSRYIKLTGDINHFNIVHEAEKPITLVIH